MLAVLPVWEKNREADFSGVVDTTKLFEFIRQVRSEDSVWMFDFEKAADITDTLRTQWAYLMSEGLSWRRNVRARGAELDELAGLRGEALRFAIEKPGPWEYKVFAHALIDAVHGHADLRREHKLGIVHPPREQVGADALHWVLARLHEGMAIANNFGTLGTALHVAAGPPGQPGSVAELAFVARGFGQLYRSAIEWSQRVSGAYVAADWQSVCRELARFMDNVIEQVETLGPHVLADVALGEERAAKEGGPVVVNRVVSINITNLDGFNRELAKLKGKYGLPDDAE